MKVFVTGSNGLIGSEVVSYFATEGHKTYGLDNNMREEFFGPKGDTRWNLKRLQEKFPNLIHQEIDIRDRAAILHCLEELKPELVVHTAAQPSHDLSAKRPFDDFDVNAVGTLNLLEATRRFVPEAVFVFLSSSKVYGDAVNEVPLTESASRWDYADPNFAGINENFRIDQSKHSIYGVSKLAADVMVQEYGRYFDMKTCCIRANCLTGPGHSGVELHGFLSYLIKANIKGEVYNVNGYQGKQVRDNIHSLDIVKFIAAFAANPRCGEVYNIGGGRPNSCSILEAFEMIEQLTGKKMLYRHLDKNREGDHICYISDLTKVRQHYPEWDVTISLGEIFEQIAMGWKVRN